MSQYQIRRGTTWAVNWTLRKNGNLVDLTGARVLVMVKINQSDPDSAAISLMDNQSLGGVVVPLPQPGPNLGTAQSTMPGSATYGLQNVQQELYYEVWVKDSGGNTFCPDSGGLAIVPRGLQQQP